MKSIDTFQNWFGTFPQYPETNFLLAENSPNVTTESLYEFTRVLGLSHSYKVFSHSHLQSLQIVFYDSNCPSRKKMKPSLEENAYKTSSKESLILAAPCQNGSKKGSIYFYTYRTTSSLLFWIQAYP